jgi:hypothetical protein
MGQMGWVGFHVVCEENVVRAHLLVVFHMKPLLFGYYEHIYPARSRTKASIFISFL